MKETHYTSPYELEGRLPLGEAVLLGLQHVLAMFASNLTPILLIAGACGISAGDPLQVVLLQNAMIIAGGCDTGTVIYDRPCGRTASNRYGNQFRFYRRMPERCGDHGRRYCGLRRDSGRFGHRRPF